MPRDRVKPSLAEFLRTVIGSSRAASMRAIARRAGVSVTGLSRIVSGERRRPGPDTLRRLAGAISVNPAYLFFLGGILDEDEWRRLDRSGNAAHEPPGGGYAPGGLSTREWEVLMLLRKIDGGELPDAVMTILRALAR